MADDDLKQNIRLIEVVREDHPTFRTKCWRVTWAYMDGDRPMAQITWYIERSSIREEGIVPTTRHWFHMLCKGLSEATADWQLSEEAFRALQVEKPPAKPPS